jgi:hypothetical protein
MATFAPSSLNFVAIPFPKPVPPPVMKTTLPLYVSGGSIVKRFAGNLAAWGPGVMFDMVAVEEVEKAEDTVTGAKVCKIA